MDLDILIKTEAELAGAKAVEQQLERDIGKAKALGLRYDEIEQKLVRVRALMSTATKVDGNAINDQINAAEKLADAKLREQRIADNNKADQAGYLAGLTKEAKELGSVEAATEKTTRAKSRLLDGIKKLGNQVPFLGAALNALKNPFTAIAAVAGIALDGVRRLTEDVQKFADAAANYESLGEAARNYGHILREAQGRQKEFRVGLEEIKNRAETAEEAIVRMHEKLARVFDIRGEQAERRKEAALAGVKDPDARAEIEARFAKEKNDLAQHREAAEIGVTAMGIIKAKNEIRDAEFAKTRATQKVVDAQARIDNIDLLLKGNDESLASLGGEAKLREEIEDMQPFADQGNLYVKHFQLPMRKRALEKFLAVRDPLLKRREGAQADARIAANEEARLSGVITGGNEQVRTLRQQQARQEDLLKTRRDALGGPDLGPNIATLAQQKAYEHRFNAQYSAIQNARVKHGANELGDAVEKAFNGLLEGLLIRIRALEANSRRQNND